MAVVYENAGARDLAIQMCDAVARNFMGDLDFEFSWWRFDYLANPEIAAQAACAALRADLILVCFAPETSGLPPGIKGWLEAWLARRADEGALAVVGAPALLNDTEPFLRLAAQSAHLDYLPLPGAAAALEIEDRLRDNRISPDAPGFDSYSDEPYHSSGWGINE